MSKIKWTNDPTAEPCFKEFGVSCDVQTISISDIDFDASRQNHARLVGKPVDDDLVTEFAIAMQNGDVFPRPVVRKAGRKYVILGGNHRVPAAELCGATEIEAYVVDTHDHITLDLLPRVLNRRSGRRTSLEEAYEHALYAIRTHGYTHRQASQLFGVSEKAVSHRVATNATRERLMRLGIDAARMPECQLRQITILGNNDNVATAAARVMIAGRMNSAESSEFARNIRQERTELAQLGVCADFEARLGTRSGNPENKKTRRLARARFLRGLTTFEQAVGKANDLRKLQITEQEEKENVVRRLTDLAEKCQRLARR